MSTEHDLIGHIQASVRDLQNALGRIVADSRALIGFIETARGVYKSGGKLMTCGNGGSAAEALHLSEELVGRFSKHRPPLPAVCLSSDPTAMTCIANDFGYEAVFARQVEALGRPGDGLVVLSTSGRSPNIVGALEAARGGGLRTLGLLGPPGSAAEGLCDAAVTFGGASAARVQEMHLVVIHLLLERMDADFA